MIVRSESLKLGLLAYACGCHDSIPSPAQGRDTHDRVYLAVLEGRRYTPPSSSCGDLAHWFLFRLGVRLFWINRDELDGWHYCGEPGHPAWDNNVTTLAANSINHVELRPPLDAQFQMGDIIILNTATPATTHVRVVVEHVPEYGRLVTADYGQPGGAWRESIIEVESNRLKDGARYVDAWLPLDKVLAAAEAAGKLVDAESAEAWAVRLGLPAP